MATLTVFADLVLQLRRRMADSVETQQVGFGSLRAELAEPTLAALPPGVLVYEITGLMFFGAVGSVVAASPAVTEAARRPPRGRQFGVPYFVPSILSDYHP